MLFFSPPLFFLSGRHKIMNNKETNTNKKKDNRYRSVLYLPKSLSAKHVGDPFDYSKNWILDFNASLKGLVTSSFYPTTLVRGEGYYAE